jgi:glucosamine--fructose-6-phosphate aminotransferase (isomerizing)
VQQKNSPVLGIVNVAESTIMRECDVWLPIHAGPEIGVASTKAFTCQLTALACLTLAFAEAKKTLNHEQMTHYIKLLNELPRHMNKALSCSAEVEAISHDLCKTSDVLFLGRGAYYPLAMEGSLKLKEISYIHAEGYAAGEMKHGPIALIDENMPVVVIAPSNHLYEKTISNMQEVIARGGKVILISDKKGIAAAGNKIWKTIEMPEVDDFIAPIVYSVPVQLLAYHTAVSKGTDVDQPRNLAKSVTVE